MKARIFLSEYGAPGDQTDAVCETIICHAGPGEVGMNTGLGLLLQLTTPLGECGFVLQHQHASSGDLDQICNFHTS